MKTFLKTALILLFVTNVFAQKKITEGMVEYTISYPNPSPEMKQMESMLPKTLTLYFKDKKTCGSMKTPMGTTTTISDDIKKEMVLLMDMMGTKIAIKQSEADLKKQQEKAGINPADVKVTVTSDTKMIAGYKCKKAIISYKEGDKASQVECYFTDQLPVTGQVGAGSTPGFDKINGFLMEYTMNEGMISMKISANVVKAQTVSEEMFKVPSDYKIMTPEEVEKMMSNPGGSEGQE